jgi:protein-tyrosine kinase
MNTIERALSKQNANKTDETAPVDESVKSTTSANPVDEKKIESSTGNIVIDLVAMEKKGFVSTNAHRRQINEEYRAIKRKILNNAFGALSKSLTNSNIVMITSSRPGEGKTFTAVNLALSIALEQDKTVLLVDADVLRPNVMRTLELENQEGLMEYLLGEKKDISEVMCNTNIPNLRIIAAGKSHHLSTELLASEKMFEVVQEFANRYNDRVVIIDTPPLLGINETAILANLAGQAIVVTEENATKLSDVEQSVSQLNPDMAIGFVVNKGQMTGSQGSGYGYYYYGGTY